MKRKASAYLLFTQIIIPTAALIVNIFQIIIDVSPCKVDPKKPSNITVQQSQVFSNETNIKKDR